MGEIRHRPRILIVEDDCITALDLKELLIDLGYSVAGVASRSHEALEKTERCPPDLALMDIGLGESCDGIELAAVLQRRFDVGIVYLTAHAEPEVRAQAELTHPLGYIVKPFEDGEIEMAIAAALCKHEDRCRAKDRSRPFVLGIGSSSLPVFPPSSVPASGCPMQTFCTKLAEAN